MNLPTPSANREEYNRILESGFRRFPERKINYDKFKQAIKNGYEEVVNYLPVKMDYESSSLCNFRCTMCILSERADSRPKQMTFENFKRSLDEQPGLIEVKLQGLGEPLLNRDFFRMVRECVSRDIWVRTTTNGSLLDRDDNYKRMIDERIGEIQVSIDGATKETFEKIRHGSNFDKVIKNVTLMNEYARTKEEQWRTSMWMLVQKDNFSEMEAVLELAEKMSFTRVVYSLAISDWGGVDDWTKVNGEKNISGRFTEDLGYYLIEKGKKRGLNVSFWLGSDKYKYSKSHKQICPWLFSRAYVTGDMRVVPCCVICDAKTMDMGVAVPFQDTWNNDIYRNLRRLHLEGNIPHICKNCYENVEHR